VFVGTYFEKPWLEVRIISEQFHAGERTEKGGITEQNNFRERDTYREIFKNAHTRRHQMCRY
jgi:hypothetical protein